MKKLIFLLLSFVLLSQIAFAAHVGHIRLLAVSTNGKDETGNVADLFLEIKPGTGKVFIDTFPLTRLDTQFSTRFAKSIACDYVDVDCSKYDFFYTIKSNSAIVGGPSAGAAITLLTIAELSDAQVPDDLAVTGTINAGGLIGPVGGIKAKIDAAQKDGLSKVIIPSIIIGNKTDIDIFINYTSVEVAKVSSIDEALYEMTGEKKAVEKDIEVDPMFTDIMKSISNTLCDFTSKLLINVTGNISVEKELYEKGKNASIDGMHYASASYCFGANVKLREIDLQNRSSEELYRIMLDIRRDIDKLDMIIKSIQIETISDLQTYIIVKERLVGGREYITEFGKSGNFTNISSEKIAYSIERYNSALAWARFFGTGTTKYEIKEDVLKQACLDKISEAKGNLQYINIYINVPLEGTIKKVEQAQNDFVNKDYELCIFKASKANAESNLVLESLSITRDQLDELIEQKLKLGKRNIIRAQEKGVFPILGYSYFEYASSLQHDDPDSALLYIGYSNELSNLNVYFPKKKEFELGVDTDLLLIFASGILIGILLSVSFFLILKRRKG
ncbi:hypothetical protein GOV08_04405 [Candidatus Woesearchaeota archaeon]|nr:hypothetical protein [Candidatus Woesearchaeota archaeon]